MAAAVLNSALWVLRQVHDDTRVTVGKSYAIKRHCSPFVFYNRFDTTINVTVYGRFGAELGPGRRVFLQRRGFRTGLLGWTLGGLLGGTVGKDIEITPTDIAKSTSVKDVEDPIVSKQDFRPLETNALHIPARAVDGYYRIRVTTSNPSHNIVATPTFRLLSSSLDTASPRGATLYQIPFETGAQAAVKSAQVAAWSAAYALFPFLAVGSWVPGVSGMSRTAIDALWRWAGGQKVTDQVGSHVAAADQTIPWGAVGVRRQFDIDEDTKRGPRGSVYRY
ncbi:hypothetical protein PYCC9005_005905 [Savitreella phatthalungensis]